MKFLIKSVTTAVLIVGVAGGVAFAQSTHQGHGGAPMSGPTQTMMEEMQPKPGDSPFVKAMKESHMRMMKDMHVKLTGDPDVDFRTSMIPHHQGAIDMAKVTLEFAKDPETKKMAQAIITDQEREIAEMQAWLKKRGK